METAEEVVAAAQQKRMLPLRPADAIGVFQSQTDMILRELKVDSVRFEILYESDALAPTAMYMIATRRGIPFHRRMPWTCDRHAFQARYLGMISDLKVRISEYENPVDYQI